MGTPRVDNYHRSLGSVCPGLAEPNNPLARISGARGENDHYAPENTSQSIKYPYLI